MGLSDERITWAGLVNSIVGVNSGVYLLGCAS